jgi:inward rectifier potassium channel
MTGLLAFALATGLLYGRFSRPYAKLLFSRHAVIAPYRGGSGLMFRIANQRTNQLIEVEATLTVVLLQTLPDGSRSRQFYPLELERDKLNFFHLSWTIVHPIEPSSPLYGMTKEELDDSDAEFLILIKAFDDTFSQTVHTRSSYKHHEVRFAHKFVTMLQTGEDGVTEILLNRIHHSEPAELPTVRRTERLSELAV